jgi:hypothetical protein
MIAVDIWCEENHVHHSHYLLRLARDDERSLMAGGRVKGTGRPHRLSFDLREGSAAHEFGHARFGPITAALVHEP